MVLHGVDTESSNCEEEKEDDDDNRDDDIALHHLCEGLGKQPNVSRRKISIEESDQLYGVQSQKRSAVGSNASGLYSPQPSRIHDATLRLKSDLRLDCKNVKLKGKKEMEK